MPRAWHALAAYVVLAVAATWPLAAGLSRQLPADLGDPVLNAWIIAWDSEQLLALLGGDLTRVGSFFDAPIFHPAPLTLAYSEHLLAQAIQGLPVYALTRDPILTYNLLFLATFILSGLGGFLFVRELTGDSRAAFVAGLLFAFAPYRMPQAPHLQVLSAQWMPLALYGFRRYFDSGRARPLIGAAAALIALNHSNIYYLMYFTPFAAAYVGWELVQRGLWRRPRILAALAGAALAIIALTLPLLLPYIAVQETLGLERTRGETIRYSADVYSYATAAAGQLTWGSAMRAFPKPEGDLFPGLTTLGLALLGIALWRRDTSPSPDARPWAVWTLRVALALHLMAIVAVLLFRRMLLDVGLFTISISNANQLLIRAAVLGLLIALLSPATRVRMRAFLTSRGFFVFALVAAAWLSLGPAPRSLGVPIDLASPYAVLHESVPGYDGLRVPARLAMVVTLMLSVLAGFGAAVMRRWKPSFAGVALGVACVLALAESVILPSPVARLPRPARAPAAYHALAREPASTVVAELPLGDVEGDLRAMFFGLAHRRPILNGYSGFFPPHYTLLTVALSDVPARPDIALAALNEQGATHVLVHEAAWPGGAGARTTAVLKERGAVEIFRDGADAVLKLPAEERR
jgi:hypothetical protein